MYKGCPFPLGEIEGKFKCNLVVEKWQKWIGAFK
jgi:hypothetical protein